MRSYVVKRLPHFKHSRLRRMDSDSLLSRESTTLSFANPQKGHFMALIGFSQQRIWIINKIITVEESPPRRVRATAVLKQAFVDNQGPSQTQNGARTPCGTSAS